MSPSEFDSPGLMTVAPLPEVEAVQDILGTMKGALAALGVCIILSSVRVFLSNNNILA